MCKFKIKCKWNWTTQKKYRDTAQTHRDEIKKAKVGLDLKLVVGVKATRTSAGYVGSKKKIKESEGSCPMDGGLGNKNIQGRLIYSVSPLPQSFLIRSTVSPPRSLPLHIHVDEGLPQG